MNIPRIVFAALLSFVVSAVAQPATTPKPVTVTRQPLWKVEGKRCSVYLLGSVHFLKEEHYPLAAPINAAFDKAKIVVFETDIDALSSPASQAKLLTKAMLPAGQTLATQISPKLYQRLDIHLNEIGLPIETVQNFRPGMVALTLALLEMQKMGLDPKLGVDQHFHQRAQKAGKEIIGLEEPTFQIDLIGELSKEDGEAMLESTLDDMQSLKTDLDKLLKAWQSGNMKAVADLLNKALEEHPALARRLLTDRNKSWIPKIEELARGEKDALVVVGTGHLAGKQSVVELLQKNGWKVVQQ